MADDTTKISTLPLSENLDDDDLLLVVEDGVSKKAEVDYLKTKFTEDLATVASSGSYNDLSNTPTVPSVEANPSGTATDTMSKIDIDGTIYSFDAGSDVSITPSLGSGTKVADYTIDGTSGSVYVPSTLASYTDDSTHRLVTDTEKSTWNGKQNALTFDNAPTSGSSNPVKSGGVYNSINEVKSASIEEVSVDYPYSESSEYWGAGYIDSSGVEKSHQWYKCSTSINCISGSTINYTNLRAVSGNPLIACYQNGTYKGAASLISDSNNFVSGTFTIPQNIDTVRFVTYQGLTPTEVHVYVKEYQSIAKNNRTDIERFQSEVDLINNEIAYSQINRYTYGNITAESNAYINADGEETSNANYKTSEYISIIGGTNVYYNLYGITLTSCVLAFYDADKHFISGIVPQGSSGTVVNVSGETTAPATAKYVRYYMSVLAHTYNYILIVQKESINEAVSETHIALAENRKQWIGKKWTAFGTSITDTNNSLAPDGTPTGKYVPYLEEMSGLICQNYGEAGGFIDGHILHAVVSYGNNYSDADIVTLEGSVNDWSAGVPIGEVGDTTPYMCSDSSDPDYIYMQPQIYTTLENLGGSKSGTFCGAVYQALKNIQDNVGNDCRVFVLTDSTGKLYSNNDLRRNKGITEKVTGDTKYQIDYMNALVSVAEYMGIPVIDAGRMSRISENNPDMIIDQIHHTEAGGKHYAATIWNYLKNNFPIDTSDLNS